MNGTLNMLRAITLRSHTSMIIARPLVHSRCIRSIASSTRYASTIADATPRIAQPSLWKSIVPKALRGEGQPSPQKDHKPKSSQEWNPFMMYIFIFLLIGSNALNLIGLRNEVLNFSQKTDRQVALLAEVIRKVQNGEDVDVAAVLGKGNPEAEKDWEEVLKELESTDSLYETEKKKLAATHQRLSEQASRPRPGTDGAGQAESTTDESTRRKVGFY